MNSMNRIMIFFLLIALLVALFKYNQQIDEVDATKKIKKKVKFIEDKNKEEVSIDNISQYSMDSITEKSDISQNSQKSNDSLSFLDNENF